MGVVVGSLEVTKLIIYSIRNWEKLRQKNDKHQPDNEAETFYGLQCSLGMCFFAHQFALNLQGSYLPRVKLFRAIKQKSECHKTKSRRDLRRQPDIEPKRECFTYYTIVDSQMRYREGLCVHTTNVGPICPLKGQHSSAHHTHLINSLQGALSLPSVELPIPLWIVCTICSLARFHMKQVSSYVCAHGMLYYCLV